MLHRLLEEHGVRETLVLRSTFGFLALHGGSLEEATDVVAAAAAERAGASLYVLTQPPELRWHVPSHRYRAGQSERLDAFVNHVSVAIAVHGYGRPDRWTTILVGGSNRSLATILGERLRAALPHYAAQDVLDDIPAALRGLHPDNPVNRVRDGGVHLELPPRVRGLGPHWASWSRRDGELVPDCAALIDALAAVAGDWRRQGQPSRPSRS